jgi:hypothetical protein
VAETGGAAHDPFAILGLDPSASIAEVYAARRDLARRWHPDLGGDEQQMAKINDAVRRCVKAIQLTPTPGTSPQSTRGYRNSDQTGSDSTTRDAYDITVEEEAFVDHPSFRVEALPAEAHEALRIVSSWLGEVVVDEPPYLLECLFHEPVPCWCQFHLLPEAGSSMVGVRVAGVDASAPPSVRSVRDLVIAALNELDWETLDATWR